MRPLSTRPIALAALCSLLLGSACTSTPRGPQAASDSTRAAFDRLKALEGRWMTNDESGKPVVASTFSVSSAGSTVREIMFPGTEHEMTNMYHLDGDSIMATHYCALGNQPRMRAARPTGSVFVFNVIDVTNLTEGHSEHMGDLTLSILGPNSIRESWQHFEKGTKTHAKVLDLTRG